MRGLRVIISLALLCLYPHIRSGSLIRCVLAIDSALPANHDNDHDGDSIYVQDDTLAAHENTQSSPLSPAEEDGEGRLKQLHYNASSYESFDLVSSLSHFARSRFSFSLWNPRQTFSASQTTVNSYTGDVYEAALRVCDALTAAVREMDATAKYRCLVPTLHTMRWRKVQIVSNISLFYETFPNEEVIVGLLTAHDMLNYRRKKVLWELLDDAFVAEEIALAKENSSNKNDNASKESESDGEKDEFVGKRAAAVCILGAPSAHSVLPALMTHSVERVLVFSALFDEQSVHVDAFGEAETESFATEKESSEDYFFWNYYYAQEAAQFLNKDIEYISLADLVREFYDYRLSNDANEFNYAHVCDAIQFQPDFCLNTEREDNASFNILVDFARFLSSQDDGQYTANLVAVQYSHWMDHVTTPNHCIFLTQHEIKSFFEWKTMSVWDFQSHFGLQDRGDLEELFFQSFSNDYNTSSLSIVRVGRIPDDPVNGSTSEASEHSHLQLNKPSPREDLFATHQNSTVIVISCTLRIFIDNIFGLQHQLRDLMHFQHVYLVADFTPQVYEFFETKARRLGGKVLHIPVSTFDVGFFGKHAIVYNSEQLWATPVFGSGFLRYRELLGDENKMLWTFNEPTYAAFFYLLSQFISSSSSDNLQSRMAIVSYSYKDNRDVLMKLHVHNTTNWPVHVSNFLHSSLPLEEYFNSSEHLHPYLMEIDEIHEEEYQTRDNHSFAMIFGTCGDIRFEKVQQLERLMNEAHFEHRSVPPHVKFYNLCGWIKSNYEKDFFILRSRVVLNIQQSPMSALETHRINHLLALGKIVISERGWDPNLAKKYEGCVIFVETVQEMFNAMLPFLVDDDAFNAQSQRVREFYELFVQESLEESRAAMRKALSILYP